jgi:hypothetical protein
VIRRVMYRVRRRVRRVSEVPAWLVARFETVTGEDRGTWGVLVSALSVGVVASVVAAFVVYRAIHRRPPTPVPGKVQDGDRSKDEQEHDTTG